MNCSYRTMFFALSLIFSTSLIAEHVDVPQNISDSSIISLELDNSNEEHSVNNANKECIALEDNDTVALDTKIRKVGGFLLTGVIVYQTTRIVGHAGIWISAGAMVIGGAITGGPAGAGAGYLGALTMVGPASAAVETGSLAVATAASFIPFLP